MVEKFVPKELNITENAVLKVKKLIAEENKKIFTSGFLLPEEAVQVFNMVLS